MTSKPTARERFEKIERFQPRNPHDYSLEDEERDFLISLVEAAVEELKQWHDNFDGENGIPPGSVNDVWEPLDQRLKSLEKGEGEK